MIDIIFLGTGCMQPTKNRNHSGILLSYKTENILMDCGEGIQRQMRIAGIKPAKITKLLISHWHGDHVFGIPGLLSTMGADKPDKKLQIYGPVGTKKYMEHLVQSFACKDLIEFEVIEVKQGVIFDGEEFQLMAEPLKHSSLCVGYSFVEKDRRRINVAKAEKLGLQGPILGKLQDGEAVVFKGKKILPDDVSAVVKGKKVSYIADTVPCNGTNTLALDADLLISEGTHLDDIKEKSEKYMHLTVKEAALIASENNAKRLVITHISQRYKNAVEIREEAKTYFPDAVVAEDFMRIRV